MVWSHKWKKVHFISKSAVLKSNKYEVKPDELINNFCTNEKNLYTSANKLLACCFL